MTMANAGPAMNELMKMSGALCAATPLLEVTDIPVAPAPTINTIEQNVKVSVEPDLLLISNTEDLIPAAGKIHTSYMSYMKEVMHEAYELPHKDLWKRKREFSAAKEDFKSLLISIVHQTMKYDTANAQEMTKIEIEIADYLITSLSATGDYCSAVSKVAFSDTYANRKKMYAQKIEMNKKVDELGKKLVRLAALAYIIQK